MINKSLPNKLSDQQRNDYYETFIKIVDWSQKNNKHPFKLSFDDFIEAFTWKN